MAILAWLFRCPPPRRMRARRIAAPLAAVLFLGTLLSPTYQADEQQPSCAQRKLTIRIVKISGKPEQKPVVARFRVSYSGETVEATETRKEGNPPRILLLLDTSGSMARDETADRLSAAVYSASRIVRQTPEGTHIAIASFAQQTSVDQDFSADKELLLARLDRLGQVTPAKGHTALFDALASTARMLKEPEPGDMICVITDGGENASSLSLKKVQAALQQSQATLFFLYLSDGMLIPGIEDPTDTAVLARDSGGLTVNLLPPKLSQTHYSEDEMHARVDAAVADFLTVALQTYELSISSRLVTKANRMRIQVVDASDKVMGNYVVLVPKALPPCAAY
jgi:Mg-chelatase subunit ChlD